jgi:DNA-binding transcriptional regulator YhcF (GntR family)
MEDWVTIRNLKKKRPDLGTRKIAELLGVSRNTVRRALRSDEYPVYKRESKVNKDLEPFFDFIRESYLIKKQKISVIISNLRSKGFKGSDSSVIGTLETI